MIAIFTLCISASFIAGMVDSIAGGGGLITMPAMLLAGLPPHATLGTGKFASSIGTLPALFNYARKGLVLWRITPLGIAFSLLGAVAGSEIALYLDSATLGKALIFLLPVGLLATLLPKQKRDAAKQPLTGWRFWCAVPAVAFAVGLYDGFFGPGAGSFFILAFHFFLRMGLLESSGTAKVFNLTSNLGALAAFCWNGQVWYALGIPMACASMVGNWLGSRLAIRTGPAAVRKFLGISLSLLMLTLIYRTFFR